jgi:hypothetical protein
MTTRRPSDKIQALVIGNQRYYSDPLNNPEKDARDFAQLLARLGHTVVLHTDLRLRDMDRAISSFARDVTENDGVLLYYAGHGAECSDENWLIPIDCESDSDEELQRQAKSLNQVLRALRKARFRITILDACRTHPFRGLHRGDGAKGLAQMSAPQDTLEGDLICYATGPKQTALDGRAGRNGVFTAALLKHFQAVDAPIGEVMRRVRRDVKEATGERQIPWESSSLTTDWFPARSGFTQPVRPTITAGPDEAPDDDDDDGTGSDGPALAKSLRSRLPRALRDDTAANGATVLKDRDGLGRVKIKEYNGHCRVRVRCSQDWGLPGCRHRSTQKNAAGWLEPIRVESTHDFEAVIDLYNLEWGNVAP